MELYLRLPVTCHQITNIKMFTSRSIIITIGSTWKDRGFCIYLSLLKLQVSSLAPLMSFGEKQSLKNVLHVFCCTIKCLCSHLIPFRVIYNKTTFMCPLILTWYIPSSNCFINPQLLLIRNETKCTIISLTLTDSWALIDYKA